MSISPSPVELRARALTDLRMGLPVVIDMPQPLLYYVFQNSLKGGGKLNVVFYYSYDCLCHL